MERIERCAGLDVHKSSVTACVRSLTRAGLFTRRSGSSYNHPRAVGAQDWLASFGVKLVGMEATGLTGSPSTTCWRTTSSCGFLTPATSRTSPAGRPTSRTPSGSASLWSTGWYAPASCLRKRSGSLGTSPLPQGADPGAHQEVQRLEKVLQDAGIKLSCVATRVLGASGRAMQCAGWRDHRPGGLGGAARAAFAPSCPRRDALEGSFSSHHALMVGKIVAHIDYLDESIDDLSAR